MKVTNVLVAGFVTLSFFFLLGIMRSLIKRKQKKITSKQELVLASREAYNNSSQFAAGFSNFAITEEGILSFCLREPFQREVEPSLGRAEVLQIVSCNSLAAFLDNNTVYFSNNSFEDMTYLTCYTIVKVRQLACTYYKLFLSTEEGLFTINTSTPEGPQHSLTSIMLTRQNRVNFEKEIHSITCGYSHVLISTGNDLYGMGTNKHFELGIDDTNDGNPFQTPVAIPFFAGQNISIFAGGRFSSVVKANDGLYAFGDNKYGQLGVLRDYHRTQFAEQVEMLDKCVPYFINLHSKVKQVSCGRSHSIVLMDDGSVLGFGSNRAGQLGIEISRRHYSPKIVEFFDSNPVEAITCGDLHTLFYTKTGDLYLAGIDRQTKDLFMVSPFSLIPTKLCIPKMKKNQPKNRYANTKSARNRKRS